MSDSIRVLKTPEEIKIFTDPYRMRIIKAFGSSDVPLTVTQVANNIGEVPAKVHYHLKKLLSINVLELDHIEVIKGINAKYYKLVTDSFKLELDENPSEMNLNRNVKKITNMVFDEIDAFKEEVKEISKIRKVDGDNSAKGMFGRREIFLTDEEFKQLQTYVKDYVKDKSVKKPGTKKYASVIGAFRKL